MFRYQNSEIIRGGRGYGTSNAHERIRDGISQGVISYSEDVLREAQRLDHIAGSYYNDSSLWWVIAAASGIGWGLQVPPGTYLLIPLLADVERVLA